MKLSVSLRLSALAVVILCSGAAAQGFEPWHAALQGTWKVKSFTINGKPLRDRQITGARLTFREDELITVPGDGSQRERCKLEFEQDSDPLTYHSTRIEPVGRPQTGWTIYEVDDDRLRLGFFDALRGRPRSFDPQEKLIVLELEKVPPADDNKGDKAQ